MRWCFQKADPPQCLHWLRSRWCSQKTDPPQSLHRLVGAGARRRLTRQSLHRLLSRWCGHSFFCLRSASILQFSIAFYIGIKYAVRLCNARLR